MIAALVNLLGGSRVVWWLVGGGVAIALVAAGYGYVYHLRTEIEAAELRAKIATDNQATAEQAAAVNAQAAGAALAEADRTAVALKQERDAAVARATEIARLKGMIENAPKSTVCQPGNDDPLAPVLASVLDGLRGRQ